MRLIDADTLKREFHSEWDGVLVWDESGETTADQFCNIVDAAPTIEAEPVCEYWDSEGHFCALHRPAAEPVKRGKWLAIGNTGLASCACGYITDRYSIYNYCPNCGAKMEEE